MPQQQYWLKTRGSSRIASKRPQVGWCGYAAASRFASKQVSCKNFIFTRPQVHSSVCMSVVARKEEYITTLWGNVYSIVRANYKYYASYVHAVLQSKALVREACEENGGLGEDDVDDTRKEIDKALDKGICCTGVQFRKKKMIRHIGMKEHGRPKVKVGC